MCNSMKHAATGSISADKFTRGRLIPNMQPFPARHFILILDNCFIHHACDVKDCNSSGILCSSPRIVPTIILFEELFSHVKYYPKAHDIDAVGDPLPISGFFKVYPNLTVDGLTMLDVHKKLLASLKFNCLTKAINTVYS